MRNYIGYLDNNPNRRVYINIELRKTHDGLKRLSICGEAGDGSFGQIDMHIGPDDITPAKNLNREMIERLFQIWKRWHMNDMQAACPHQRAFAEACGVDPHIIWSTANSKKQYEWVLETQYGKKFTHKTPVVCPICNYSYGSQWLHEELPTDVLEFLFENFRVSKEA